MALGRLGGGFLYDFSSGVNPNLTQHLEGSLVKL